MADEQQSVDQGEVPQSTVQPVGELLRQAREARGLQVDDIAQTLKLGFRQVEALETGDWQGLPGPTFIRGFVRNYARLVHVDAAPLMVQLDQVLARPADNLAIKTSAPAPMPSTGGRISRRDRMVVVLGVGLVALAALVYFLLPSDLSAWRESAQSLVDSLARKGEVESQPAAPQAAPPAAAPTNNEPVFPPGTSQQQVMYPQVLAPAEGQAVAPQAAADKAEAGSQPGVAAPQLRFLVDKESWVEVRDRSNKVIFSQRLSAGTEQAVSGQGPLSLTIGYAPGVRLFWLGQAIDLAPHTRGDVARLVLE